MTLSLVLACGDYDRIRPLLDGGAPIEGVRFEHLALRPGQLFPRALQGGEFDLFELSASAYLSHIARGNRDLVGLPVFVSRAFRHSGIYIRTDRGIDTATDLRGKRVGVPDYAMTGAVWQRGFLADDHGVSASDIQWFTGGLERPGASSLGTFAPPANLSVTPIGTADTLSTLLERGQLDALLSSEQPSALARSPHRIARLFPDYRAAEQAYYRRHRLHPIMHLIVVRRRIVERHPELPARLYQAFCEAKRIALAQLSELSALPVALPWLGQAYDDARTLLGEDIWPYGVEANRRELETLLRYAREQGLAAGISMADLFPIGV